MLTRNAYADGRKRVWPLTHAQFEALGPMIEDALHSPVEGQASAGQADQPSLAEKKLARCDTGNCGRPAMSSLELKHFCVDHFITLCYERLNQCNANRFSDPNEATSVSIDRFLLSCAQQAARMVHPIRGLDNLERARLFDILLWASELAAKRGAYPARKTAHTSGS